MEYTLLVGMYHLFGLLVFFPTMLSYSSLPDSISHAQQRKRTRMGNREGGKRRKKLELWGRLSAEVPPSPTLKSHLIITKQPLVISVLSFLPWWWHPTPVLLPGKSHGLKSLEGCSHGVTKSRTRLSDLTFTFHFHALEKEMATHSSVLAWRIPGTAEPGGLSSMGSHRVRHDWSDLAAAAAAAAEKR